jgi:hypothetical protein
VNRNDEQYAKISDTIYMSLMFGGLGFGLATMHKPSLDLPYLFIGVPCIILGALKIIRWNIYYDHRISNVNWIIMFLVLVFLWATVLLFITPLNGYVQGIFSLSNVITIILLIILFISKRKELHNHINK